MVKAVKQKAEQACEKLAEWIRKLTEDMRSRFPFLNTERKWLKKAKKLQPSFSEEALIREHYKRQTKRAVIAFILGTAFLGGLLFIQKKPEENWKRAAYGDGDRSVQVEASLWQKTRRGRKKLKKTLSVYLPEQEMTEEEKIEALGAAARELRLYFDAFCVDEGLEEWPEFPEQAGELSVSYESLSPDIVTDDFRFLNGWPEKRTTVSVLAEIRAEEMKTELVLTFTLKALSELSEARQLEQLEEDIQAGRYLEEDRVSLPSETASGAKLSWTVKTDALSLGSALALLVLFVALALSYEYVLLDRKTEKRERELAEAFPAFITETAILMGAGLSVENAWSRMAEREKQESKTPMEEELRLAVNRYRNGCSAEQMMDSFASSVNQREISRAVQWLKNDRKRGDGSLSEELSELVSEAWNNKKNRVREKAAETEQKLLLPLFLMLIAVLLMVMAPALMTMRGL